MLTITPMTLTPAVAQAYPNFFRDVLTLAGAFATDFTTGFFTTIAFFVIIFFGVTFLINFFTGFAFFAITFLAGAFFETGIATFFAATF